jgi:hypothetical protein
MKSIWAAIAFIALLSVFACRNSDIIVKAPSVDQFLKRANVSVNARDSLSAPVREAEMYIATRSDSGAFAYLAVGLTDSLGRFERQVIVSMGNDSIFIWAEKGALISDTTRIRVAFDGQEIGVNLMLIGGTRKEVR